MPSHTELVWVDCLERRSLVICLSFPWIVRCASVDLSCEHVHPNRLRPRPLRVLVFDRHSGATGLMRAAFPRVQQLMMLACDIVRDCPCADGCLGCVLDPNCSEHNVVIDKRAAGVIMDATVARMTAQQHSD